MLIGHDLEHSGIFLPLITTNCDNLQPDAAGGERRQKHEVLPMCNAVGDEQNGVISDENRQGIFVFTWF